MGILDCKIADVYVHKLNSIHNPKGNIYHVLKKNQINSMNIGEIYMSEIHCNEIKGWKKHHEMILNLIVPIGDIKFVIYDDRKFSKTNGEFWEITIGENNYCRLCIPPNVYVAFQGIQKNRNLLINIASIEHDPSEASNLELSQLEYKWF
jgi:dTDP-4-dehydrorhamnose 3,5-epimerase